MELLIKLHFTLLFTTRNKVVIRTNCKLVKVAAMLAVCFQIGSTNKPSKETYTILFEVKNRKNCHDFLPSKNQSIHSDKHKMNRTIKMGRKYIVFK